MGTESRERIRTHAVYFDDPNQAMSAVRRFRAEGFEVRDVHTPFAVHGMDEALGLRETGLPWATFIGGALGCSIAAFLQIWTHAFDWPLNIGGKSDLAIPALVPVAFELTILLAAFGTVFGLLFKGRLFPRKRNRTPPRQPGPEVTDNAFVLLLEERDASFSEAHFRQLCSACGSTKVVDAWRIR